MQKSEIWMIKPVKPPAVRRQCPGCGKGLYESTGRFRVNANGNRLDVWLIYRCMQCGKSWNMEILERVESGKLSEEKLLKYQENDEEEALRAACSNFLMNQNRVEALWETLEYEVEKSGREDLCRSRTGYRTRQPSSSSESGTNMPFPYDSADFWPENWAYPAEK